MKNFKSEFGKSIKIKLDGSEEEDESSFAFEEWLGRRNRARAGSWVRSDGFSLMNLKLKGKKTGRANKNSFSGVIKSRFFGYGSLVWNPEFEYEKKVNGFIKDYSMH